jgi:hypothetical protein
MASPIVIFLILSPRSSLEGNVAWQLRKIKAARNAAVSIGGGIRQILPGQNFSRAKPAEMPTLSTYAR